MYRAVSGGLSVLVALAVSAWVQPAQAEELKANRVALFSSGVGYFESAFNVEGTTTSELKLRVDQINDALKSLVLRDLDGGTISAVQYPSRDPVERALKSFAVDITGRPTLGDLLNQLRGAEVEIKTTSAIRGSILGVEKESILTGEKTKVTREILALLTDEGLRTFPLRELSGIKILDAKLEGELRKALATLAASHDSEKKTVTLTFAGEGKRRVMVGYMLETPIWKTSYRLVLSDDKKPYLQGWAIVENTTDQDWENVRMSLVSGRPISFSMDLYEPLYVPRPVERLAMYESLRAPTYEGASEQAARAGDVAAKGTVKPKVYSGARGGAAGGGLFAGGGPAETSREYELKLKNLNADGMADLITGLQAGGVMALANADTAGELFEYCIQTPVSLKRQNSAMLPIVTAEIEGQKLSIYNPATHPKYPVNGLKLKNTSGLFLTQGPVTVFDGGVYAGDAKLPDLRADEDRLIAYALDLSTEVDMKRQSQPDEWMQFWVVKGTMWQKRKLVDDREYVLKNKGDKPRTVMIEQPIEKDWQLVEPKEPAERTASLVRFKLDLPPAKTESLKVRAEKVVQESLLVSSLNTEGITGYIQQKGVSESLKQALAKVIELQTALADVRRQIKQAKDEVDAIGAEQNRIRENMKTLSETSDVRRRYEKKLDEQETRIEELRGQLAELQKQETTRQKALEDYIASLDVQ